MFEYKQDMGIEVRNANAPTVDNGNTGRLVEVIQKARMLGKQREDLEEQLLRNQADITATAGLLQEMLRTLYQEDAVVKYLADAILFTLGRNGIDPSDKSDPF